MQPQRVRPPDLHWLESLVDSNASQGRKFDFMSFETLTEHFSEKARPSEGKARLALRHRRELLQGNAPDGGSTAGCAFLGDHVAEPCSIEGNQEGSGARNNASPAVHPCVAVVLLETLSQAQLYPNRAPSWNGWTLTLGLTLQLGRVAITNGGDLGVPTTELPSLLSRRSDTCRGPSNCAADLRSARCLERTSRVCLGAGTRMVSRISFEDEERRAVCLVEFWQSRRRL